ncbi:MAG TPA: helix-turn-helix domain-containing protein [Candidatus Thermoplasmatota archaeon]|nr:helix-turn-helix domain-containing protein [Candidatus Thermoplasmatota archaeon]
MRRQVEFAVTGRSPSPVYDLLLARPKLRATIRTTCATSDAVSRLVIVQGPERDLDELSARLAREAAAGGTLQPLARQPGSLAFFDPDLDDGRGRPSLPQLCARELGPRAAYAARVEAGALLVTVTAPAEAPFERFVDAARTALAPSLRLRLLRLGPAPSKAASGGLAPPDERILLHALSHGYFDEPRRTSIRLLAARQNRSKSALEEDLRRAVARLCALHLEWIRAQRSGSPSLAVELWAPVEATGLRSAILSEPALVGRVESLSVVDAEAWEILVVEGPPEAVARLDRQLGGALPQPILAREVLERSLGRRVIFERWARPREGSGGFSPEHLLRDACGAAGALTTEFRHGAGRLTAYGSQPGLARFAQGVRDFAQGRYRFVQIPEAPSFANRAGADLRALRKAAEGGFFASPRRIGLAQVGREIHASASTAGIRIRRALARVILTHVPGAHAALAVGQDAPPIAPSGVDGRRVLAPVQSLQ